MKTKIKLGWYLKFDWFKDTNTVGQYFLNMERNVILSEKCILNYDIMLLFIGFRFTIEK